MTKQKTKYSAEFKGRVALEAIKGELTINEITTKYKVHSTQISRWKQQALLGIKEVFSGKPEKRERSQEELTEELYKEIGRQKVELEFLKKRVWD